jgi:dihydrodipicolinate synthase/N-acetylneuraminate lyase
MSRESLIPHGEALRRAVRWLGEQGGHDVATLEEAARRFDLTPAEEQFLLEHFRRAVQGPPDR